MKDRVPFGSRITDKNHPIKGGFCVSGTFLNRKPIRTINETVGGCYLVPIHGYFLGSKKFPIQKCAIFCKFKEIKELRGGVLVYAAQVIPPIDAEIAEKGHLWTETI
ncbi:MAG: hypothetical protein PVG01_03225 [Desulfobacterales bacterium]|jgi:hypothetical protein